MCSIKSYKAIRFSIRNIVMYIWWRGSAFLSIEGIKGRDLFSPQAKERGHFFPLIISHVYSTHISLSVPYWQLPGGSTMHEGRGHLPRLKAISENCWPNWPLEVKQFVNTFLVPKHVSARMQLLNFQSRCLSGFDEAVSGKPETRLGLFTLYYWIKVTWNEITKNLDF